ncbi:Putative ankyrin repeat-containing domain superfamily [Septoria linicola]|uniref:Ankyrin repeat-containing domain superfamily n=1 Tax=Septoria linicola TaxID=215465 RepID=A0A9Q9AQ23_9PEZI|nr:Putative ankyrin repeat-containing domain superfamily [Septoria linicola]
MNQKDATGKTALQRVSFLAAATQDKKHYATIKTLILLGAHAHTLGSDVLATLPSNLSAFIKLSLTRPIQSLAQQAVFNTDGSDLRSARTSLIGALAIITANTFGMDYSNHASTTSGITAGDHANMRLGNNYDHQAHTGATASGDAKQYNGNVINTNTYHYSLPQKRSDGKLGENERNEVFLQAAKQGQLPRVRYLLQCGADVDHTDQHGKSGLHHAAVKGYTDVVEHLISHGVGIDTVDVEGETALYNATQRGRTNVVAILLGARADPIAGDGAHGWPLHVAYWKREIWTL